LKNPCRWPLPRPEPVSGRFFLFDNLRPPSPGVSLPFPSIRSLCSRLESLSIGNVAPNLYFRSLACRLLARPSILLTLPPSTVGEQRGGKATSTFDKSAPGFGHDATGPFSIPNCKCGANTLGIEMRYTLELVLCWYDHYGIHHAGYMLLESRRSDKHSVKG
jgi:hypothetical protein